MLGDTSLTEGPWPSHARAWGAVAVLLTAYVFAYVDRAALTVLVEPIQRDLDINDTQISLLHGFAFVIFYVGLGLPIGHLADRFDRRKLITSSIALWSVMTALCGTASSFAGLFVARIGVGVGEAGLSPASYSLIADYFAPARRSLALGVYQVGIFLGGGLALLIGGAVVAVIGHQPSVVLPIVGVMRSWQVVFLAIAAPGLFIALTSLLIREPARRTNGDKASLRSPLSFISGLRTLDRTRSAYLLHFFGFGALGLPFNVALLWARPYFTRHFQVSPANAAYLVGSSMVIFATLGILCGSLLADRLQTRGLIDATVRVGRLAGLFVMLPIAAYPFMPSAATAAAALSLQLFFGAFAIGAAAAALQLMTENRSRALVSSIYLLVTNLIGLAIGPTLTGAMTDYVFHDPQAVGFSASIVSALAALVAVILLSLLLPHFRVALSHQMENRNTVPLAT